MKTDVSEWSKWPKKEGVYLVKNDWGKKYGGKTIKVMTIKVVKYTNNVIEGFAWGSGYKWTFKNPENQLRFHPFEDVIVDKNKVKISI